MKNIPHIAIIGAGPAGLAAAETLSRAGCKIDVFDAMPSFGRKFLMAGKSGLNITHGEPLEIFLSHYTASDERLADMVRTFGPDQIQDWMRSLGVTPFSGTTGRVFPVEMKASPLLRAWLRRLDEAGVSFHRKHAWTGWSDQGALSFNTTTGLIYHHADATILAMGGASWKRLGSNGQWTDILQKERVNLTPFKPSNCGFLVDWSDQMKRQHSGSPVKTIKLTAPNGVSTRSEFVITQRGVESGGIYTLSASLRDTIDVNGEAILSLDLLPDVPMDILTKRLSKPRGKQSHSNFLRKAAGLTGVKLALLYECIDKDTRLSSDSMASLIKSLPLPLMGTVDMDEAISTAGGVSWASMDDQLMLKNVPGVFCAGEMIDWDAPTGGYLLTACMATGHAAANGALNWLGTRS